MSSKERRRLELFGRVQHGELTLVKAAEFGGVSYRQAKRLYSRFRQEGDAGLVHRLRGRASNRKVDPEVRSQVIAAFRTKYADFGPTLAAEYLARDEGLVVSVPTLRRWLVAEGLWQSCRRRSTHRRWRARKEHFGEMIQMDGSDHDWFEGRRGKATLMVMIDDATSRVSARFFEEETTAAAFEMFREHVGHHGLPRSLYVDRASIYKTTRDATTDESLAAEAPLTQFGRAMQELEVRLILAKSPQAKGRVERQNGLLQDRLVKGLRLAKISDLASANRYLEETFLPDLNERFMVTPEKSADVHRRVPRTVKLERVLSFQESRVVQSDWTVSWRNRHFQLTKGNRSRSLVKQSLTVCEQLDGTVLLLHKGRALAWEELPERPRKQRTTQQPEKTPSGKKTANKPVSGGPQKPSADHPWRKPFRQPREEEATTSVSGGGPRSAPSR